MNPKNRRKTLIISPIQFNMVIAIMGLIIGISIILVATMYILVRGKFAALTFPPNYTDQLLSEALFPVVIIGVILFLASIWAVVLISHKVYGPLYRLNMYIKKLTQREDAGELKFRTGDAVEGLNDIYNQLRQMLENTLHYNYDEMVVIFNDLQNILDKIYHKKIQDRELFDALQDVCNRIAQALDITSDVIEPEKNRK